MAPASADTVLARFDGVTHADRGVAMRPERQGDGFRATVDGTVYTVHATFGVFPLQQYLVGFPGGRLQVLPLAWDARPAAQGGQRWFNPARDDAPAWASRDGTWNFMCAECHTTGLERGYDLRSDSYRTTFAEAGVGCEACHGPGAAHVAWARGGADPAKGPALGIAFARDAGAWGDYDAATGIRRWLGGARGEGEIEVCAACHARRRTIAGNGEPGRPFLDRFEPVLLTAGLYQPDGQILDEDFEWGSFQQSRMHTAGVTCRDCHDVHALTRHAEGNALCATCHNPIVFDRPAHTHHASGTPGAVCTECHMPSRTYMGVHVRHDHGFRVPRPDLAALHGGSDACTACHRDRGPAWAAAAIAGWLGHAPAGGAGEAALAAARASPEGARRTAGDATLPAIVRATALSLLGATAADAAPLAAAARDPVALIRYGAARAEGEAARGAQRALLADPVRAIRIAAGRALAGEPAAAAALADWRDAEMVAADRPESHVNLGSALLDAGGAPGAAEAEFAIALRQDKSFVPAMIDWADAARLAHDEPAAEGWLRKAIAIEPGNATAWYALGLCLVRQGRRDEAETALARAAALAE